ncbi:acyl-CoA desaturase [Sorangium atrum]|uniref:Acyl-CoA desaturase n=1 Tax=Sorangium atrum TaxID=2995308 RepID=A0ABT5C2Z0_9BACT|nr:acyl-CoA desaturase [Sorangium aterium]MDC0680776.1 acyl-CoA desaturase [Sorangium aterium]
MKGRTRLVAIAYLALVHAGALLGLFLPIRASSIALAAALYAALQLSTVVGLHRLLSHRAFRCPKWVEYALVSVAMISGQGSPIAWVATHRRHHAHTDREGDVHSPRRGLWYAHLGWILDDGSTDPRDPEKYCRDLVGDPYYRWLLRWRFAPQVAAVLLAGLALGWAAVPFVFFVPLVCWMHATYLVNSVCHAPRFGSRAFDTRDGSRNVGWVAVLTFGEGWHNNHHAFPRAARQAMAPGQHDLAFLFIRALAAVGLASDIQPSSADRERLRPAAQPRR